jgi:hypothetical protein
MSGIPTPSPLQTPYTPLPQGVEAQALPALKKTMLPLPLAKKKSPPPLKLSPSEHSSKRNWSVLGIEAFGAAAVAASVLGYGLANRQSGVKNGVWLVNTFGGLGTGTGGFSIQDATTNLMTAINSGVRIFYAFLTHQHMYETTGYEVLNRVGTVQMVRLIKDEEKSPFSLARLGLDALMKPRQVVRENDLRAKGLLQWLDVNWQNSVKNRIQKVAGLNTPFEIMVKGMDKAPAKPGDLRHHVVNAHEKKLTLQAAEGAIFKRLIETETLLKNHEAAQQAFEAARQTPSNTAALQKAYHQLATAQYELNLIEHPRQSQFWRGQQARHAYDTALRQAGVTPQHKNEPLPLAVKNLHHVLDNQIFNTDGPPPHLPKGEAYVDWKHLLAKEAKKTTEQEYQSLRHELKLNYVKGEVLKVFKSLLVDNDGKPTIPKNIGQKIDEVLFPYMKEATKYYNCAYFRAAKPDKPQAYHMNMLSDKYMQELCNNLVLQAGHITHVGKRNTPKEHKQFEKQATEMIGSWVENAHETYNLLANHFTNDAAVRVSNDLETSIGQYVDKRQNNPTEQLGYHISRTFQQGRYLERNTTTGKRELAGPHYELMNKAFHLNERLEDLDKYRNNRNIKLAAQIGFQTALSAFILGNVLFFVVYNSFARLDPDYQGEGTPMLANAIAKLKSIFSGGANTAVTPVPPTPLEAKVDISVNFAKPLRHYGSHFTDASATTEGSTVSGKPLPTTVQPPLPEVRHITKSLPALMPTTRTSRKEDAPQ